MKIATNVNSLNAQRASLNTELALQRSIQRLSSGLRVNSAKDDAAGLAISTRMTAQIRGLNQAVRNANDAISLLQTSEAALGTVNDTLQRIRELAVQAANDTNSAAERRALAAEVTQLTAEIGRINQTTTFNSQQVFNQSSTSIRGDENQAAVVDGLKLGWLENSESLIRQYLGLQGDGAALAIQITAFTDGAGGTAARVTGSGADGNGRINNVTLQVDMADFVPPNLPNGGSSPFYNDRIIAHEVVHAVQYRSLNVASMTGGAAVTSTWFLEGMAELIHGADERLSADIAAAGGAANLVANNSISSWDGDSGSYSTAYAAMRYLHQQLKNAGYADGLKDMLTYMSANSSTLDAAFTQFLGIDHATFRADFQANGAAFIGTMNLTNSDTGAIGGFDADAGAVRTAESVIDDYGTQYSDNVLSGFTETFEQIAPGSSGGTQFSFHVGADRDQTINAEIGSFTVSALGLATLDIEELAQRALVQIDDALNYVNSQRAEIGAQISRFESAIKNTQTTTENISASRSRILDADYATEAAALVRAQILRQANISVIAQANLLPQLVLSLLR